MPLSLTTVETILTKSNKAIGAGIGAAIGTLVAYYWPMPVEVQGAMAVLLSAGVTWFAPKNKGA